MDYKVGSQIPEVEVLKRFKDENGDDFLEVRGLEGYLFRVTEGNRVYYKIDYSMLNGEELTLVDDYSNLAPADADTVAPEQGLELDFSGDNPFDVPEFSLTGGMEKPSSGDSATLSPSQVVTGEGPVKDKELEEGSQVPPHLIPQCKPNDYGGYTLRHNRFLYILDKEYYIDVKTPDAALSYDFSGNSGTGPPQAAGGGTAEPAPPPPAAEAERSPTPLPVKDGDTAEKFPEFNKGDVLPGPFRLQCEQDLMGGGGSRITLGNNIYMLDGDYRVTVKMKMAAVDDTFEAPAPQSPSSAPPPSEPAATPLELPVSTIIGNMTGVFDKALDLYGISADYFRESVLCDSNRNILRLAYNGDLGNLNDDTKEASAQGQNTLLDKGGFTLFKSVLIHELYIKSTLTGRGDNMKYFLTHIMVTQPDGSLDEADFEDRMSRQEQHDLMVFFGKLSGVYKDKSDIIKRVYRHLRTHVHDEYEILIEAGKKLRFGAYLIMKLYQQTTRLDRGDGITIMCLTRDLMNYKPGGN